MRQTKEKIFDDYTIPTIEYKFTLSEKTTTRNVKMQTKEIQQVHQEVNTKRAGRTVKLQVEEQQIRNAQKQQEQQTQDEDPENNNNFSEESLQQFMKKVTPLMINELENNIQTLETYEPQWTHQQLETKIIYTLQNKQNKSYETKENLDITSISWNSNGFILAVSYGKFSHNGACQDKSLVALFNINKRQFNPDIPTQTIETDSCIMTIEFHPVKPSILVGGSFNGEIFLWDTSKEDEPLISKSSIDDYFHREMITQFMWWEYRLQGSSTINYNLLSISTDGKILLWEIKDDFSPTCLNHPIKGFSLVRKKDGDIAYVGGLCFAQASQETNTFIVGSETGSILRANLKNISFDKRNKILLEQASSVKWKSSTTSFMLNLENKFLPDLKNQIEQGCRQRNITDVEIHNIFQAKPEMRKLYTNPITFAYEQHFGPVYSISFSPFYRNLFLTSSLDGSVKLYDVLSPKQLMSVEIQSTYVFKVEWSLTRPSVFSIVLSNGEIRFYDFLKSKKAPIQIIENNSSNIQALNLKINKKQNDLIAVAYSKCQVKIIQLSSDLIIPKRQEDIKFANFIDELKNQI